MDVVTGALGILAPKLLQLLGDEYKLHAGVKEQVRSLCAELESVHAFLRKVTSVPWDQLDEQVKLWAREVREASYDMEDVLDTFLVRVQGRRRDTAGDPAANKLKRAINKMGNLFSVITERKDRHGIARAIQRIKKQIQEVADRRARYRINDDLLVAKSAAATSAVDPRLAAMHKEVAQLVAIDKPRGVLISMLVMGSSQEDAYNGVSSSSSSSKVMVKKVSIVGVGGLGKTTLAKAVYDKLKPQYACGAFVSVGRNPDLAKVFKDILFNLDKFKYDNIHSTGRGVHLLISELQEFLENRRYFIVIDDVWESESWETIKLALVDKKIGSAILTTTRNFEVARAAGEVYKLPRLSYDNSKMLFYTRIFGGQGKCIDEEPDGVSDKILKKCDGIPLAIITMASLLVGKPREAWSELYSAVGFGHKDNLHVENTMRILSFSYYDLPSHLRTCLLYLSAFPEDYSIPKDPLIRMWIAEGFVNGKQGKCSFEVGERYFNDLINRSMIQVVESEPGGTVSGCRVHDMVLDLIRSLSCEENFVTILGNAESTLSQSKLRRLACHKSRTEHITPHANNNNMDAAVQVRSYIACRCNINNQWAPVCLSFKFVRVVHMEGCELMKDDRGHRLESLGNLLHLRYLAVRNSRNVCQLPEQIGALKLLQTLDVEGTGIKELPASIVQLTQLVCLSAWTSPGVSRVPPDGIVKLTALEVLIIQFGDQFDESMWRQFVKELGSLVQLRVLSIGLYCSRWDDDDALERDLVESLRNLHNIQELTLLLGMSYQKADMASWEAEGFTLPQCLRHLSVRAEFSRLPSCIDPSRLHHLSYLKLSLAAMDQRDLKLLGRLRELRYLVLPSTWCNVTLSNLDAGDGYFQKLRCLEIPRAMVHFGRCDEDDSPSISFHIWKWNEFDDPSPIEFKSGSRKGDGSCSSVHAAVMPSLENLVFRVFVRALENTDYCTNIIGLEYLPCLERVIAGIDCAGAPAEEVERVEAQLHKEADGHPKRPMLETLRLNRARMI